VADGPQRIPTTVGLRRAVAGPGIQIGAAARAEPFAVFPAEREFRNVQQPLLADGGPEVHRERARGQAVSIRIISDLLIARLHEQQMHIVPAVLLDIDETAAARSEMWALRAIHRRKTGIPKPGTPAR